jgi:CRISPR-associated protein Csd1
MTILQALNGYYDRMAARGEAELPGWSREKFGFCIVLAADGSVVDVQDLRDLSGKKPTVKLYQVPAGVKRTVGIASNFLWDKSAYVLGRTAGEGKRTAQEHEAFKGLHAERLASETDEGLVALRRFLAAWTPDQFAAPLFRDDMLDANIMFRLDGDRNYLHERPAAQALINVKAAAGDPAAGIHCLITGERGPAQRLHPTIKGVEGAQSSGAALVSFNLDAFTSLGKEQGDNAPTSEAAAFRYGAALNRMLDRGSSNRVPRPIGDASVVFWADTSNARAADAADDLFAQMFKLDEITDAAEARKIAEKLKSVAEGRPVPDLAPDVVEGTRFHILGLSPNAARLSVRFWETDSFGNFARRLQQHYDDMQIDPPPKDWGVAPSVNRLLVRTTALGGEYKNIPRLLAGEVMRAVLTGGRYPQTLLSTVIMRLRAGLPKSGDGGPIPIGWHAAVIRGVLQRNHRLNPAMKGVPMSLDVNETNAAYCLGRLFAALEYVQERAIEGAKATIRSRFLASASAAPAGIFPTLLRLSQHHIVKLNNQISSGAASFHDRQISEILDNFPSSFPKSLTLEDQGRFYIGYYHQRASRFRKKDGEASSAASEEN